MIKYSRKLSSSSEETKHIARAVLQHMGVAQYIVYNVLIDNPGIGAESLSEYCRVGNRRVAEALAQLFRADLLYSDFEDYFCSVTMRSGVEIYSESNYFFMGKTQKPDIRKWEIYEEYCLCRDRTTRQAELFNLLMNEDKSILKCNWFRRPSVSTRLRGKQKKKRGVKYFGKPLNALGFPLRRWDRKADAYWWIQKVMNPHFVDVTYKRKPGNENRFRTMKKNEQVFNTEYLHEGFVREQLIKLGLKHNIEEMTYWVMVMSSRLRFGVSDEGYIARMYHDFKANFPGNKPIRMADVKIFYTLGQGMSKLDFLNTE